MTAEIRGADSFHYYYDVFIALSECGLAGTRP